MLSTGRSRTPRARRVAIIDFTPTGYDFIHDAIAGGPYCSGMPTDSPLLWKREGPGWILSSGRRRFGRVIPDSKYPGMWRSIMSDGSLSDMANLAWAKNAVLIVAEREMEYAARSATHPSKCPEKGGVFEPAASPMRKNERELVG